MVCELVMKELESMIDTNTTKVRIHPQSLKLSSLN